MKIIPTPALTLTFVSSVQPECPDSNTGEIIYKIVGGQPPYTASTTGPESFTSNSLNLTELQAGTYKTIVNDSSLTYTPEQSKVLTSTSPVIILGYPSDSTILPKQCDPTKHKITLDVSFSFSKPGSVEVVYLDADGEWQHLANASYTSGNLVVFYLNQLSALTLAIKFGDCYSNDITLTQAMVAKPAYILDCNITRSGGSPFTYVVAGTGGIGNYSGTGIFTDPLPTYTKTITDSVGCQATGRYP